MTPRDKQIEQLLEKAKQKTQSLSPAGICYPLYEEKEVIEILDQLLTIIRKPTCSTCGGSGKSLAYAKSCPECGRGEIVNGNLLGEGSRQCKKCLQDWWLDVKYAIGKVPCPDCICPACLAKDLTISNLTAVIEDKDRIIQEKVKPREIVENDRR